MNVTKVRPPAVGASPDKLSPTVGSAGLRLYVVDDHPVVRAFLAQHLEKEFGFSLCGWSADSQKALAEVPQLKPDPARFRFRLSPCGLPRLMLMWGPA